MASDGMASGNGTGKRGSGILRVLFGPGRGKRYELMGEEFILGNGDDADIKLEDSSIEARHAVLTISGEHARIRPFGKGVGFRVNGRLVEGEIELGEGSQIEIGGVVLSFAFRQVHRLVDTATTRATETAIPAARDPEPPVHERTHEFVPLPRAPMNPVVETSGDFETKVYHRGGRFSFKRILSKSVSWSIVILVFAAGAWVGLDLYHDVIQEPSLPPEAMGTRVCRKAAPEREPRRVDEVDDFQPVTGNDRDIVRVAFDEAMSAYWAGDLQGALSKLQALQDSFPDFMPPFGGTLPEIQNRITKLLAYKGQLSKAFAVATDSTATKRELEEVLAGLKTIPRNDFEFGPSAELFVRELERRLDRGDEGFGEEDSPMDEDLSEEADAPTEAQGVPAAEPVPQVAPEPSPEATKEPSVAPSVPEPEVAPQAMAPAPQAPVAEASSQDGAALLRAARSRAKLLYEAADFDGALNEFLACAQRLKDQDRDNYRKAAYWARKLRLFDESLTEGMRLLEQDPASAEGLALLEQALKADRVLFSFYQNLVGKQVAEGYARRALALVSNGNAVEARKALSKARGLQRNLESYARVEELLLTASEETFDRAMACSEGDRACAVRLLKEVIAVAPTRSRVYGKAVAILDELSSPKTLPDQE